MRRWWEWYEGRLDKEVERLKDRGFTTAFDPTTVQGDVVEIAASYRLDGRQYDLRIVFPHLYPYFRPQVFAAGLALPHHQNPFEHNLCLLGRNTECWDPSDLIADVIAGQLPKLINSEEIARTGGKPEEELQAEPWTEYLAPNPEFRVAWNPEIDVPEGATGIVELTYIHGAPVFRAYVSRVLNDKERALFAEKESAVPDARAVMRIPFLRLGTVPPANQADVTAIAQQKLRGFNPYREIRKLTEDTRGTLLALFYPEETGPRKTGTGLVLVLFKRTGNTDQVGYIKTYRASGSSLAARLGAYGSIRENRMLLVGFGSLGSAVAVGLCKLGVRELTVIDRDVLEPGNSVRHALGMQYFGMDKPAAAVEALKSAYPYTKIGTVSYRLGEYGREANKRTTEFLAALETSSVIVDCSAERAVQQFLSDEAWRTGKQYFFAEGYPGMLGGFIGNVAPGSGPCYLCFLNALEVGAITAPSVPPNPLVQPAGCGEPTFVGASFDADTLGAGCVRLIFGTLAKDGNYPLPAAPFYRATFATDDMSRSRVLIESMDVPKRGGCDVCDRS